MRNVLRSASILALFAAALSAHAGIINAVCDNSGYFGPDGHFDGGGRVRFYDGPYGPFSNFYNNSGGQPGGKRQSALWSDQGILAMNLVYTDFTRSGTSFVEHGSWTLDAAASTGIFRTLRGSGLFTSQAIEEGTAPGYYIGGNIVTGSLSPVPEPASVAALGLGALAMVRRRKRA